MIFLFTFFTRSKLNERSGRYHTLPGVDSFAILSEYKYKTMSATVNIYYKYFHYEMLLYLLFCSNVSSIQTLIWRFCYRFFQKIFINFTPNC